MNIFVCLLYADLLEQLEMTIGQKGGRGRGLCHVEDCNKPTLVDVVGDIDMLSSVPPKSTEGHPFLEQSNPVNSLEVTPTANCK